MDSRKMKLFMLLQQIDMTDDQFVIHFEHAYTRTREHSSEIKGMAIQFKLEKPLPCECLHDFFATCERSICGNCNDSDCNITCANTEIDERTFDGLLAICHRGNKWYVSANSGTAYQSETYHDGRKNDALFVRMTWNSKR